MQAEQRRLQCLLRSACFPPCSLPLRQQPQCASTPGCSLVVPAVLRPGIVLDLFLLREVAQEPLDVLSLVLPASASFLCCLHSQILFPVCSDCCCAEVPVL